MKERNNWDTKPTRAEVEPEEFRHTQKKADQIVYEYSKRMTTKALDNVEKTMLGEGCLCPNCIKRVVRDANSWINFMRKGEGDQIYYVVSKGRRLEIHSNFDKSWQPHLKEDEPIKGDTDDDPYVRI